MKQTQADRTVVKKGWGQEDWIANSEKYCGKVMTVLKGKRCSYHFHELKDEVFWIASGQILLKYGWSDDISEATEIILVSGDSFHVPVGLRHQFLALEDAVMIEFSTQHFDTDSKRIIRGD